LNYLFCGFFWKKSGNSPCTSSTKLSNRNPYYSFFLLSH